MSNTEQDFQNKSLNCDVLEITDEEKYAYTDEVVDYALFETNNWLANTNNSLLRDIELAGGALWVNQQGMFCFRHKEGEPVVEVDQQSKMERLISIYLNRLYQVRFFKFTKDTPPDVAYTDLRVVKDEFSPWVKSEFYYKNGVWCRTSFVPSRYLSRDYDEAAAGAATPVYTLTLIDNLVNCVEERRNWVLNWLAGFYQTLKRSRVSLVLRGDQGSGKGLFFNEVISKLFGEEYSVVVSDENLESDFKSWVDEKLFYNLNEIAVDMKSRRNIKNFLKQLVTDDYVNVQSKFKDFKKVKLYGNILITSNEAFPIEVEVSDRRFTVFQTGKSLKSLGIDTTDLVLGLRNELPVFAEYLRKYNVDWKLYHTALDTPEKQAIVDGTTSSMRRYIHAVISRDLSFFEDLNNSDSLDDLSAYNSIEKAFIEKKIERGTLYNVYERMYESKKSAKKFAIELRNLEPSVFGKDKLRKSGGKVYYEI